MPGEHHSAKGLKFMRSWMLRVTECTHLGPLDRFDYSTAIADSWKQQMLLNVVKIRYMDLPVFVDVASIVNGYSIQTGVSVNGSLSSDKAIQGELPQSVDRPSIPTGPPSPTVVRP